MGRDASFGNSRGGICFLAFSSLQRPPLILGEWLLFPSSGPVVQGLWTSLWLTLLPSTFTYRDLWDYIACPSAESRISLYLTAPPSTWVKKHVQGVGFGGRCLQGPSFQLAAMDFSWVVAGLLFWSSLHGLSLMDLLYWGLRPLCSGCHPGSPISSPPFFFFF